MKLDDDQIRYVLRLMLGELSPEITLNGIKEYRRLIDTIADQPFISSNHNTLSSKGSLLQNGEENPMTNKKYLAKTKDSISGYTPLAIFHEGKSDCLFLMKDNNNICYVTPGDMIYSMMYNIVLASGELCCQISDSPESRHSPSLMEISDIKPHTLTNMGLTQDQMSWLRNPSIMSMVSSVQSEME